MENTIAFTYNPYIYFESYKNVLNNVRLHYPDSDIFIYMDSFRNDLQKYIEIASKDNCITSIRQNEMFYIHKEDSIEINLPKMVEWIERIKLTCKNTKAKWILLLEDDVIVTRQIKHFPSVDVGTNREYFRVGGGAIFKKEMFLNCIEKVDIEDIIRTTKHASWAGDLLLEHIFTKNDVEHEKWIELAEPGYYDNTDHAIYHGYKDLHKLN
jgi:hypothetical protein